MHGDCSILGRRWTLLIVTGIGSRLLLLSVLGSWLVSSAAGERGARGSREHRRARQSPDRHHLRGRLREHGSAERTRLLNCAHVTKALWTGTELGHSGR